MADRFKIPSVPQRMDRCGNCRYFAPEIARELPPTCRLQNPTMVACPGPGGQLAFVGMWAPTKSELWCAKWEALNERDVLNQQSLSNDHSN